MKNIAADPRGLFPPESITWQINREVSIALVGLRALLMQVAHPLIGQGVYDHSGFREKPLRRLFSTLNSMIKITFGTRKEAEEVVARIRGIHNRVQGTLTTTAGQYPSGHPYSAQTPELLLWVFATLVDSSLSMYELLFRPLTIEEKDQYYLENQAYARMLGVPDSLFPAGYFAFEQYMDDMISGGTACFGEVGKELADAILYPRLPLIPRRAFSITTICTLGLLPAVLRDQLPYAWNGKRQRLFRWMVKTLRFVLGMTPRWLRQLPHLTRAERRWEHTPAIVSRS